MVVVNVSSCIGCRRCERSCPVNGITFNEFPIKCMHCDKNPCLYACPENAIERINNKVVVIKDKCIGCGLCALACPFGAIIMEDKAYKCILCDGDEPACVKACSKRCLELVDVNDLIFAKRDKSLDLFGKMTVPTQKTDNSLISKITIDAKVKP